MAIRAATARATMSVLRYLANSIRSIASAREIALSVIRVAASHRRPAVVADRCARRRRVLRLAALPDLGLGTFQKARDVLVVSHPDQRDQQCEQRRCVGTGQEPGGDGGGHDAEQG